MSSVGAMKSRVRGYSVQKSSSHQNQAIKPKHKKSISLDDKFLEDIDWDAITSKNKLLKDTKSELFYSKRQIRPLGHESQIGYAPLSEGESDRKRAFDDTHHNYPMTKITKRLFLGNDHDSSNEAVLRKEGITHVLSMVARKWTVKRRGDWKPNKLFDWSKNIKRMCVPLRDDGNSDVIKLLEKKELWDFILDSQKRKKRLLIHCQMGMNRSPTMVLGFLMKYDHLTLHQAWRLVKQKRIIVQPHVKYIRQLRTWNMYLHGSYSTPDNFLEMKVSGEGITVLHEYTNTQRMKNVLVESGKELQDESTYNKAWESNMSLDTPLSPGVEDLLGSNSGLIVIESKVTFTDSENGDSENDLKLD